MSTTNAPALSPKAATARTEFLKVMKRSDEIGWQECYDRIQQIAATLDTDTRRELNGVLGGIKPESPDQRLANAIRVLEGRDEFALVIALKEEMSLTDGEMLELFEPAVARADLPEWIRGLLNVRVAVAKAAIKKAGEPVSEPEPEDPMLELREQFEEFLEKEKKGFWCLGDFRAVEKRLDDAQRELLADVIQQIRDEMKPCFDKALPKAVAALDQARHSKAADAMHSDNTSDAAFDALEEARQARNVPGWVKGLISHRLYVLEGLARARRHAEGLVEADGIVAKEWAEPVRRVLKIIDQAAAQPKMGAGLLQMAEKLMAQAIDADADPGYLIGLIKGQGGNNTFVSRKMKEEAIASAVAQVPEDEKVVTFKKEILRAGREALAALRKEFGGGGEAKKAESKSATKSAEPVTAPSKKDGKHGHERFKVRGIGAPHNYRPKYCVQGS